ncbi:MAG: hypothetical protein AB7S65_01745 [Sulfuricurvum sp.]
MNAYQIQIAIKNSFIDCSPWLEIINQWIQNNIDYLEKHNFDDAAYWHNEMANISCLSGAIWKLGGVAVCEYTIDKDTCKNGKLTQGEDLNGRADLYFMMEKKRYLVEAKYIRAKTIENGNIQNAMHTALKNCQHCRENGLDHKMAMVFAAPNTQHNKIDFNNENLNYDIKVMLKVNAKKKPQYKCETYDCVYLFGQHLNNSESAECKGSKSQSPLNNPAV